MLNEKSIMKQRASFIISNSNKWQLKSDLQNSQLNNNDSQYRQNVT